MSWWKFLLPKRASGPQLDSELRFHIDELTQANIAQGMPPDEARRRAMLEFGGQEQVKEEVRDVYRVRIIDSAIANGKPAMRFLRKSPSFSATIILTLALGIGARSQAACHVSMRCTWICASSHIPCYVPWSRPCFVAYCPRFVEREGIYRVP
jgi:hypothetical protein